MNQKLTKSLPSEGHGLILVNKPKGLTSHDVVDVARKALQRRDIGHCGTLDPDATGLLVLLIGEATKLSQYLLNEDKTYEAEVLLGVTTDTFDLSGTVVEKQTLGTLNWSQIQEEAESFSGSLALPVPAFSAVKVDGEKLYEKARRGETFEVPVREMHFRSVLWREHSESTFKVGLECAKGGFIRSWAHEFGKKLGLGACLASLVRTKSAPYSLEEAIDLEALGQLRGSSWEKTVESLGRSFVPIESTLPHWQSFFVQGRSEDLLRNGQVPKDLIQRLLPMQKTVLRSGLPLGVKVLSGSTGELRGLLEIGTQSGVKIRKIFNFSTFLSGS